MKYKTLIKKCNCMHCLEKQEQINRSKQYWSKVLTIPVKDLFWEKKVSLFLLVNPNKFKTNFKPAFKGNFYS